MYPLFLIVSVALVILSPVVLELYLMVCETRAVQRRTERSVKANGPKVSWMSPHLR